MPYPDPEIKGTNTPHAIDQSSGSIDENGKGKAVDVYRVQTLQQCATWGPARNELGWRESSRSWSLLTGNLGYELSITYEGSGFDGEFAEDTNDYSMDLSFSEEPIESHPNFLNIMETYGGVLGEDQRVVFPPTIPSSQGESNGLTEEGGETKNPLFEQKTYLALRAVFRHTYYTSRRPKLDRIGNIVKGIPGGFDTPEGHDWLVMPPKAQRKGRGQYQVTQEYLLSEFGGWPKEVYAILGTSGQEKDEEPFFNEEDSATDDSTFTDAQGRPIPKPDGYGEPPPSRMFNTWHGGDE